MISIQAIALEDSSKPGGELIQVNAAQIPLQVKKVIVDQTGNVLPMTIPDEEIGDFVSKINAAPWSGKEVSPAVPTTGTLAR